MGLFDFFTNEQDVELGWPRAISKHMASVALYEKRGLDSLYPDFKEKILALMANMNALGLPIQIQEGFRTAKRQDTLYTQVPPVTHAKGLQSYHNYGLACDLVSVKDGFNAPDSFWQTFGAEAKKLGLIWGGDFTNLKDLDHVEWHPNFTWHELETYFSTGQQ